MEGRELQRRKQVQIPNICAQGAVPAVWHRFSPFRSGCHSLCCFLQLARQD